MSIEELESERQALATELDRAVEAIAPVGSISALKRSEWYQDRAARIRAIDTLIVRGRIEAMAASNREATAENEALVL